MFAIIVLCLIIWYPVAAASQITPIVHSPGIYYDPVDNIYFYNDYWKVITHIDVVSIEPHLNNIENLIKKVLDLCVRFQLNNTLQCKDVFSPIEVLLQANFMKLNSLSHIIISDSPNRFKRSLEFGGQVLKFFFGTLDAEDARKYDAAISACQSSESELFRLMKENIHVVKSTINTFNTSIIKLSKNEFRLNSQIDKLNGVLSQTTKINNELIYVSQFNNLVNIIEGSLLTISNSLETVLNAILFAKSNVLHPSVITPKNLLNELLKRANLINKRLDFPVPLNIETIHSLIDVSKLTVYYYKKKIVFVIQIPLISSVKFTVYKLIPLPTPHNQSNPNSFALIHSSKPYLAISDNRLYYTMLDSIIQCKKIDNDYSICPAVTILASNTNPSCETKLLTDVILTLPKECDSKLIYGYVDIWQKLQNNRWIFVQSKPSKLTLKCNDTITDYSIIGTGILQLTNDCIGYSKTLQFTPSTVYSIHLNNQFVINFDITRDNCCNKDIFNKTISSLSPLSLSNIDLDSLKHSSQKLDVLEKEINNFQEQSHFVKYAPYYSGFSYFLTCLIILFLIYKLHNRCCRRRNGMLCCVQIFNTCTSRSVQKHSAGNANSMEMKEISDPSEVGSISNSNRNLSNN